MVNIRSTCITTRLNYTVFEVRKLNIPFLNFEGIHVFSKELDFLKYASLKQKSEMETLFVHIILCMLFLSFFVVFGFHCITCVHSHAVDLMNKISD